MGHLFISLEFITLKKSIMSVFFFGMSVLAQKSLLIIRLQRFSPVCSYRSFIVSNVSVCDSFLLNICILAPLLKINAPHTRESILVLLRPFRWPPSLSACYYHSDLITLALYLILKSGRIHPPTSFFFQVFWLFKPFAFSFRIPLSLSVEKPGGIWKGIAVNL